MRFPPENTGSCVVIMITIGSMSSCLSPFLAQTGHPVSLILILAMISINICLCYFLSEPGLYLPDVIKISDSTTTFVNLDNTDHIFNDIILNNSSITGHSASFTRTFHERYFGVQRPRLNESSMDSNLHLCSCWVTSDNEDHNSSY